MAFISDSKSSGLGPGFMTLRSAEFQRRGFSLGFREFVGAVEVLDRQTWPVGFGQYRYRRNSAGDIVGGCLWHPNPNADKGREIPMWRFSTPVKTVLPEEDDQGNLPEAPDCRRDLGIPNPGRNKIGTKIGFLPILEVDEANGAEWLQDDRLSRDFFKNPGCRPDRRFETWSNMPAGVFGVSLIPDKEDGDYERLFMHTDPRLISVSQNDPTWSTLVADCEGWEISTHCNGNPEGVLRVASLHSLCRVIPSKIENHKNCIVNGPFLALQAPIDPCELTSAGCIAFQNRGHGRKYTAGMFSNFRYGGPFHPGHLNDDKHKLATDPDNNHINPLHIAHDFFFYQSKERDGPLKVDGNFSAGRGDTPWEVDFVWDSSIEYTYCGERLHGKWRWEAWVDQDDSSTPPSSPGDSPPWVPWTWFTGILQQPSAIDDDIDQDGHNHFDNPFPVAFADSEVEGRAAMSHFDPGNLSTQPVPEDVHGCDCGGFPHDLGETKKVFVPIVGQDNPQNRSFLISHREKSFPSILFRPQFFHDRAVDIRYLKLRDQPELKDWTKRVTPIVARLESFGLQDEFSWTYGVKPDDLDGRYREGTSDGLISVLPAELGLEDYLDTDKLDLKVSSAGNTGILFPDNTGCYFGRPSFTDSAVPLSDGYRQRYIPASNELKLSYYDGSAETEVITVGPESGSVNLTLKNRVVVDDAGALTISGGSVTATGSYHSIK